MIDKMIELGSLVEKNWEQANKEKNKFPEICLKALEDFSLDTELPEFEKAMGDWLIKNPTIPTQLNVYNTFGQPPVTIFNNGEFVIDVYFWTHYNTSIHSHSFSGAFKVIYGQSLHEVFSVKKDKSYTHDIELNKLTREDSSILYEDDTHMIKAGDEFCHRVIHLDQPTLTLCIRTTNDSDMAQWHYFENGLSIRKRELSQDFFKKLFYYQYLLKKDEEAGTKFLEAFMVTLDDSQTMNLFEQVITDGMGLEEWATEPIHDYVMGKYQDSEWFKLYEKYYEDLQEYVDPLNDTASDRFLAHATNTGYTEQLVNQLLSKISSNPSPNKQ